MKAILLLGARSRAAAADAVIEAGLDLDAIVTPPRVARAPLEEKARTLGCALIGAGPGSILEVIEKRRPEVVLSVGWPHLLGPEILAGAHFFLNSHPTLLPKYRGPNPWYHVIANGETRSGVTLHRIDAGMDTGPILHQRDFPLSPFDTYRSLRAKTLALEPVVIREGLERVREGTAAFRAQREEEASSYPGWRVPEDSRIDSARPLRDLVDAVRACDPDAFPAFFEHCGQRVYIRLWRAQRPAGDHPESL
jgi:methionyl-tRNA formyltransferase